MAKKFKLKTRQAWGKVRRFGMYCFYKSGIRRGHARRVGRCERCGACCRLLHSCQSLLRNKDGSTSCRIHGWRPPNCRMFPVNEADLLDRDGVLPDTPCGFSFKTKNRLARPTTESDLTTRGVAFMVRGTPSVVGGLGPAVRGLCSSTLPTRKQRE